MSVTILLSLCFWKLCNKGTGRCDTDVAPSTITHSKQLSSIRETKSLNSLKVKNWLNRNISSNKKWAETYQVPNKSSRLTCVDCFIIVHCNTFLDISKYNCIEVFLLRNIQQNYKHRDLLTRMNHKLAFVIQVLLRRLVFSIT